jgi:hypothetical protein
MVHGDEGDMLPLRPWPAREQVHAHQWTVFEIEGLFDSGAEERNEVSLV